MAMPSKRKAAALTIAGVAAVAVIAGNSSDKDDKKPASSVSASAATGTTKTVDSTKPASAKPAAPAEATSSAKPAGSGTGHIEDVSISSCEIEPTVQYPAIKYTVTNHSSKRSNYIIEFTVTNAAGQQLGTAVGSVNNLEPGQSTAPQDTGTLSEATGPLTCKVSTVTRYAA